MAVQWGFRPDVGASCCFSDQIATFVLGVLMGCGSASSASWNSHLSKNVVEAVSVGCSSAWQLLNAIARRADQRVYSALWFSAASFWLKGLADRGDGQKQAQGLRRQGLEAVSRIER